MQLLSPSYSIASCRRYEMPEGERCDETEKVTESEASKNDHDPPLPARPAVGGREGECGSEWLAGFQHVSARRFGPLS